MRLSRTRSPTMNVIILSRCGQVKVHSCSSMHTLKLDWVWGIFLKSYDAFPSIGLVILRALALLLVISTSASLRKGDSTLWARHSQKAMRGKTLCFVLFPYAVELAQPSFTRKDAAADGTLDRQSVHQHAHGCKDNTSNDPFSRCKSVQRFGYRWNWRTQNTVWLQVQKWTAKSRRKELYTWYCVCAVKPSTTPMTTWPPRPRGHSTQRTWTLTCEVNVCAVL